MRWFFEGEHPVTAVIAVIAIVCAMLLIMWARVEVHGTEDLEAVLDSSATRKTYMEPLTEKQRALDAAVTSNRFATGLSP